MKKTQQKKESKLDKSFSRNTNLQSIESKKGKEKRDNVTMNDLKGKKVDGDPSKESDQPLEQF